MDKMIGCCGLTCTNCPAFMATQANDSAALERVALQWREEFNAPEITTATILCDGCMGGGRLSGYCSTCKIRACAVEREVVTCAYCTEYDADCELLTSFLVHAPEAKVTLTAIRAAL